MTREQKLKEISAFYMLNAEILVDTRLSDFEKILYSLINGLSKGKDGCYASDKYFAQILNKKSVTTIGKALKNLEDLGYIFRFTESKGEGRGSERHIYTQETLKNKGGLTRKKSVSTDRKKSSSTYRKKSVSLIDKEINNNNSETELSELEKIKNRVFLIARDKKYNMGKVTNELARINNLSDLKSYEKRIINGELRF